MRPVAGTILEHRDYVAAPGRGDDLLRRFVDGTFAIFDAHGIEVVSFGRDAADPDRLAYVVRWQDAGAMERGWAAFAADEAWMRLKADTERDGPMVQRIDRRVLAEIDAGAARPLR
jgi:heme-degrading monooxygenase HmoA